MKIKSLFMSDLLPVWMIVLSFGPYVLPSLGIRTEHLLIYFLAFFGAIILLVNRRPVFYSPSLFFIFLSMLFLTVITSYSTLFGYEQIIDQTTIGKIISHAEKYLRPMAVIIALSVFFKISDTGSSRKALINVSKALLYMLAINSTLVLIQLFVDLSPILSHFTYGMGSASFDGETRSVSELGMSMGRFSGIFNQPAEAGLTYALGLFAWAYLSSIKDKVGGIYWKRYLLLGLVSVGGFFTISKLFIVLGIPLFVVYLMFINKGAHVINFKFFLIVFIGIVSIGYFVSKSETFYSLYTLVDALNNRSLEGITGGRFGEESTVIEQFQHVWEHGALYGLGFASYTCLDNGYLEFFVQGGIVCLAGYVALLIGMALTALKHLKTAEGKLLMFIVVYVSGAAVGMPPLTANRFSPIVWVFIVLIMFVFYSDKKFRQNKEEQNIKIA